RAGPSRDRPERRRARRVAAPRRRSRHPGPAPRRSGPALISVPRFQPSRTLRPTREGWWCLLAAVGVGFAAVSTGNNLLYLLEAMLLGLVVVSGLLSEMSMRGIHLPLRVPDEVFAGRPALFTVLVVNTKRRLPSYSIA